MSLTDHIRAIALSQVPGTTRRRRNSEEVSRLRQMFLQRPQCLLDCERSFLDHDVSLCRPTKLALVF